MLILSKFSKQTNRLEDRNDEVIAEQIIEKTQPDERKQYSFPAIKGEIVNNPESQSLTTSTPSMTDSGVITLNINNQPFNISVFIKASLMVTIATLNMLAEKFDVLIKTQDQEKE